MKLPTVPENVAQLLRQMTGKSKKLHITLVPGNRLLFRQPLDLLDKAI
jgi:hypothetical protein